jgi:hypothetical protein
MDDHAQETAEAHNLELGSILDDAGAVGTATPAGAYQAARLKSLACNISPWELTVVG